MTRDRLSMFPTKLPERSGPHESHGTPSISPHVLFSNGTHISRQVKSVAETRLFDVGVGRPWGPHYRWGTHGRRPVTTRSVFDVSVATVGPRCTSKGFSVTLTLDPKSSHVILTQCTRCLTVSHENDPGQSRT